MNLKQIKFLMIFICILLYGLDALIVTPYVLRNCETCYEAGRMPSFFVDKFGEKIGFYFAFPIGCAIIISAFFILAWIWRKKEEFAKMIITFGGGMFCGMQILIIILNLRLAGVSWVGWVFR